MSPNIKKIVFSLLVIFGHSHSAFSSEITFDATDLYERVKPSLCAVLSLDERGEELAFGSGFVISEDGKIVTNAHVISGAKNVNVECDSKQATVSKIIAYKEGIDLAVLQSGLSKTKPLKITPREKMKPGGLIFALGNPLGLQGTITSGLFSGVRSYEENDYLQLSASVNPGNSGGPIITTTGEVIGVAAMGISGAQGLNFAIPADVLLNLPQTDINFVAVKFGNKKNDANSNAMLSGLSVLGLPFGSECSAIQYLDKVYDIGLSEGNWEGSAEVIGRVNLFDHEVFVFFTCRGGVFTKAKYFELPIEISNRVFQSLQSKYGKPSHIDDEITNIIFYDWELGEGKKISYTSYLSHAELYYVDTNLYGLLEKKEVLKAINDNLL